VTSRVQGRLRVVRVLAGRFPARVAPRTTLEQAIDLNRKVIGFFASPLGRKTTRYYPHYPQVRSDLFYLIFTDFRVVCTENLIRVDDVMESPKLAE